MNRVTITLTIDLPDGVVPDVGYGTIAEPVRVPPPPGSASLPEEPPFPDLPPVAESTVPQCPTHGPMTYHPAGPNAAGTKQVSASYRCDKKVDGKFCPTKTQWL